MAKVACYRPDGTMVMKEPVDARECVENCGFTMEKVEIKTEPKEKPLSLMNKTELAEVAEKLEVEFDGSETKAIMLADILAKLNEEEKEEEE